MTGNCDDFFASQPHNELVTGDGSLSDAWISDVNSIFPSLFEDR